MFVSLRYLFSFSDYFSGTLHLKAMHASKLLKYSAGAVIGSVVLSEIGWYVYKKTRNWWLSPKEVNEVWFTRGPINRKSILAKHINIDEILRSINMIVFLIDSTKYTISLCMYIFTNADIGNALKRAHDRGVKIRVIVDQSMQKSSSSRVAFLLDNHIPVHIEKITMHHKFCIIDAPDDGNLMHKRTNNPKDMNYFEIPNNGLLITGSCNFTMEALTSNHENILLTSQKEIVNKFLEQFNIIWKEQEE